MPKEYTCPHCEKITTDHIDHADEDLPKDAGKSVIQTVLDNVNPGIGALWRGASLFKSVGKLINGITIKCEHCDKEFQV